MAVEERKVPDELLPDEETLELFFAHKDPRRLTQEEMDGLLEMIKNPPSLMTPRMQEAIANYKRIEARMKPR